jgi:hypothetical protein
LTCWLEMAGRTTGQCLPYSLSACPLERRRRGQSGYLYEVTLKMTNGLGRHRSPLKPKYGLNGAPKAFVAGVIALLNRFRIGRTMTRLPARQQTLGAPFKPCFGLEWDTQLSTSVCRLSLGDLRFLQPPTAERGPSPPGRSRPGEDGGQRLP